MGRKTLESFPGGQPLKNRVNVVLTTDKNYKVKDTVIVHSVEEMVEELKKYNSEDVYVIGGEYLPPTSSVLYKGLCYKDRSCI